MAQKGGKVDASGERIRSFRLVTDADADAGIGSFLDPIRFDPTGTTVQPVSVVGTVTTTGGAGGGGAATIADAADVAQGATTDAAVISDVSGTLSAKLRGLVKIFADVWDSVNHRFNVAVGNFPSGFNVNNFPVTQPVSGTVAVSNLPVTQPVSGTVTTSPPVNASENVAQFGGNNVVTGTGASGVGVPRVTVSNDSNVIVTPPTLTKATQGATGFSVQELKDAGRNNCMFYTILPIVTTASEALLSLTGFKSDATVATTTTPAVVTAAKKFRITNIAVTYVAIATAGSVRMSLRKKVGGTIAVTDPVLWSATVGGPAAVAGVSQTVEFAVDMEINAGDGIGVSQIGLSTTQAAAAVGYGSITLYGYEY